MFLKILKIIFFITKKEAGGIELFSCWGKAYFFVTYVESEFLGIRSVFDVTCQNPVGISRA